MATENPILRKKHSILGGPQRHHFLHSATSCSYYAEDGSRGGRLVPGACLYLPIEGQPGVCDCAEGESCGRCHGMSMLAARIIGTLNTDLFGNKYLFFAVITRAEHLSSLETIENRERASAANIGGSTQVAYGLFDPSHTPRGWIAPCHLTLEQLHKSLLAGAIGTDDLLALPAKLRHAYTVHFPGTKKPFIARKHFKVNLHPRAHVQISFFPSLFNEIEEAPVPASDLCLHWLQYKSASLNSILSAFGGKDRALTSLAEIYYLLEKQPDGERVGLTTNGLKGNLFFVKDKTGKVQAIFVKWDINQGGWSLHAYDVWDSPLWPPETRVITRVPARY